MRSPRFVSTAVLSALLAVACTDAVSLSSSHRSSSPGTRDVGSAPQLAICPVDSTEAGTISVIGALGGVLSLGGTSISIPPGSVPQATAFQIVIPESQYMRVEIHAVGLSSFLFQQPVTVILDYSRCPSGAIPPGATLQAVYVDSTGNVLQDMGGQDDSANRRLTFSTGHLSGYAVAY